MHLSRNSELLFSFDIDFVLQFSIAFVGFGVVGFGVGVGGFGEGVGGLGFGGGSYGLTFL